MIELPSGVLLLISYLSGKKFKSGNAITGSQIFLSTGEVSSSPDLMSARSISPPAAIFKG